MGFLETVSTLFEKAVYGTTPLMTSLELAWYLFIKGGWVIVAFAMWKLFIHFWVLHIQHHFEHHNFHWVLLAIDVPKDNIQSPKAVENIFAHLAGAHGTSTLLEKYWIGKVQAHFSMEIVSIEGYVQFIIRTTEGLRDLVEAAVYSQYPDAQITEIEDYTKGYPTVFPDERYDMYGTEFVLVENEALPFRTYPEFEHQMTQELKDPLNAMFETMSKIGPGEQYWFQINIEPINNHWKHHVIERMKEMTHEHHSSPGIMSSIFGELMKFGSSASQQFAGKSGVLEDAGAHDPSKSGTLLLPPFEREQVEAMARKIKKIGFETKIRYIYIATKERYAVNRGRREAFVGAIKQFNTEDINSLKPDTKHVGVHANYFFKDWRKNRKRTKIMASYKERSVSLGRSPYVLNTEELASLWHFPAKTLTEPIRSMVQRTDFKHTPPPTTLPYASELPGGEFPTTVQKSAPPQPPNLPTA